MITVSPTDADAFDRAVRLDIFGRAAETGHVPTAAETAEALGQPQAAVEEAQRLINAARPSPVRRTAQLAADPLSRWISSRSSASSHTVKRGQ